MDKNQLGNRIKTLRAKKGMSQELLAETSGLSLRTIQRIEYGDSNPTNDSLKRLANALDVSIDDIVDWTIQEDKKYLSYLNLSALTFLFFPLLGILVPFIIWTSKKGKIQSLDKLGKDLLNFQITWTLFVFLIPILLFIFSRTGLVEGISMNLILLIIIGMYLINMLYIFMNFLRLVNNKDAFYGPKIKFLR